MSDPETAGDLLRRIYDEEFGFLPTNVVRVFMDAKKSASTQENLPLLNLLFMNGDQLKYEQR